jgi:uncharacterized protein YbaP (TraB family)
MYIPRYKYVVYARDHLIYKRNRRMGARVIELLVNNPGTSYFFAFGAGHFVGENTVLDVVRNAGTATWSSPRGWVFSGNGILMEYL